MSLFFIIFPILLILVVKYSFRPRKPPILGVYQQENGLFYLKYFCMYALLSLRKFSKKRSEPKEVKDAVARDPLYATEKDCLMDWPQPLQNHPKAIDAIYFNGSSKDGAALVCGIARRPKGVCNAFLYLKVKNGMLLLTPKLPGTTLQQTEEEEGKYEVEGLKAFPIKPLRSWKIQYKGIMKLESDPSQMVSVELDAEWQAQWPHFNYDSHMSPSGMARDMARETWSREYFQTLQNVHQTHYEQQGDINGTVKINDEVFKLQLQSVRDHSFGKFREWKNFHRYALHYMTLDNGDRIGVGKICMPVCFSSLSIGFVCRKSDKKMFPVDLCDLDLFRHGENFTPPLDYAFQFKADGHTYTVQVDVTDSPEFYIGDESECRVVERLAKFSVDGEVGWGAAEWHYRNMDSSVLSKLTHQKIQPLVHLNLKM